MHDHALVLVAHGSRDPRWRAPFERLVEALRAAGTRVELGYLEAASPSIPEAIEAAATAGARRITVLPLFMASGGHVAEDIPRLLEPLFARWPDLVVTQLPPVGEHPRFVELLLAIARDAADG
jgi:sirohydrochlorin cobaltochelatase